MKTLEKDRARRYETASGLAEDIRRHLAHEPVVARGPSTTYRLCKFLRRHRAQTIAALAIVLLAGAAVVVLSQWNQDRLQLAEAQGFCLRYRLHPMGTMRWECSALFIPSIRSLVSSCCW
jgi:hypothetical protein